jgi:hypothetical protein
MPNIQSLETAPIGSCVQLLATEKTARLGFWLVTTDYCLLVNTESGQLFRAEPKTMVNILPGASLKVSAVEMLPREGKQHA